MNLAGFLRNAGRLPSTGSEWADSAIPQPQAGHGRMLDPNAFLTMQQPPQAPRMQSNPMTFSDTGFAGFLRNQGR
jgi:hypothetical protein